MTEVACTSAEGCSHRPMAWGLCKRHYQRAWSHGDLPARPSVEERFWSRVEKTETCWLWRGSLDVGGYGRFAVTHTKTVKAHRWAYERLVGPIPDGLTLDHLCRVRNCIRPEHLEPVSIGENLLRGETFQAENAAKTHCPQGHPYDEANTRHYRGRRHCRAWAAERKQRSAA